MKTRRSLTWPVYASCVALVLAGLAWVTFQVVSLESKGQISKAMTARQQAVQLTLWRMDSMVAPLIAAETARPYFHYRALHYPDRSYSRMWQPGAGSPVASPLLDPDEAEASSRFAVLYFQIEPDGRITSPQSPTADELLRLPTISRYRLDVASDRLGDVALLINQPAQVTLGSAEGRRRERVSDVIAAAPKEAQAAAERDDRADSDYDASLLQEYAARQNIANLARNQPASPSLALQKSAAGLADSSDLNRNAFAYADRKDAAANEPVLAGMLDDALEMAGSVRVGPFEPEWLDPGSGLELTLVLIREVVIDNRVHRQGIWLDWPALRAELSASVSDIWPDPVLIPAVNPSQIDTARRLATIPVRFEPGARVALDPVGMSPIRQTLLVTWLAVLAAVTAIGFVLRATIRLGARRGRFVTAVTHELRTPLTTFRLYSQMLADGMVSDEAARREYLTTLKHESRRLSEIVENVLEYARLARRSSDRRRPRDDEGVTVQDLLVRLRPTLSRRAEQSGMDLIITIAAGVDRTLTVDPQSVERILLNLVENACKYAGPGDAGPRDDDDFDPRIHLDIAVAGDRLEMLVADYGPGIPPGDRGRIFGEFQRGRAGARADRSGLGLGLALSRGLAREAGGDLVLAKRRGHGAEFLLTLPLDPAVGPTAAPAVAV